MYFIYVFYLKSPPVSHPMCTFCNQVLHMWYTVNCLDLHPHMYMYKIKTTIKKFKCFTNDIKGFEECSPTCPSLCLHGYSGPTWCPLVELYTSWHGWQVDWHLPSCLPSSSLMPHEGHPWLPWPNVGKMPFLLPLLSIVWGQFLSPPSFSSIHAYWCAWCPLVVPYFSQSLGAWAPLPNTSTTLSYHSPSRHGCWCPMCPFRGVSFKQSCIQNKLHSIYYSTCTVKSPTPPTCASFKLFNVLCVYVLYV